MEVAVKRKRKSITTTISLASDEDRRKRFYKIVNDFDKLDCESFHAVVRRELDRIMDQAEEFIQREMGPKSA